MQHRHLWNAEMEIQDCLMLAFLDGSSAKGQLLQCEIDEIAYGLELLQICEAELYLKAALYHLNNLDVGKGVPVGGIECVRVAGEFKVWLVEDFSENRLKASEDGICGQISHSYAPLS